MIIAWDEAVGLVNSLEAKFSQALSESKTLAKAVAKDGQALLAERLAQLLPTSPLLRLRIGSWRRKRG